MTRIRYVDVGPVDTAVMEQAKRYGLVVKRGNQHGSAWYATEKGSEVIREFCKRILEKRSA